MKEQVKLVVVIPLCPLGPKCTMCHIEDTLHSVVHYTTPDRRIIAVDDSGSDQIGDQLKEIFPELIVLKTSQNNGYSGGLYKTLSMGYLYAYEHFDFQVLMKIDTDALIIGHGLADDAIRFFEEHPDTGQIGTYRIGCNGEISEFSWPSQQLRKEMSWLGWLKDRERCSTLRHLVATAQAHGYEPGEHCLGGATVFSGACIERLAQENLLGREEIRRSVLQEDHLFSLLVKAIGMHLGDFGTPDHPLAVRWQGLPSSPQQLVERRKKVIHSTRFWEDMDEDMIRSFFRARREPAAAD